MHRKLSKLLICLIFASAQFVWAQVGGTLSGRVTAASGAPVPNAAVTITNATTNASQRTLTGPDGSFSMSGLPPGMYKVEVESAGFKRTSMENVELSATGPQAITVTLESGAISQTVEIKATAPVIQDEDGEVSIGFETRPIRTWPVFDRNTQALVGLMSGVTLPLPVAPLNLDPLRSFTFNELGQQPVPITLDPMQNLFYSTNGQSVFTNQYYTDGSLNLEQFRWLAIRNEPPEAVQQMNIRTSNYNAPYNRAGGAIVQRNVRGGTNDWHGSLFEFWSGNKLRSSNFFTNVPGNSKPKWVFNQFGATIGKGIIQDKLFFFASYQGTYRRGGPTQITTVPTAAMRAGDFSAVPGITLFDPTTGAADGSGRTVFPGNVIPGTSINAFSSAIANSLPLPNQPGTQNNFVANIQRRNDSQELDGRLDYHMSDRTAAFLRYGYSNFGLANGSILNGLDSDAGFNRTVGMNTVANIAHSFGDRFLGEFRFGYNRYTNRLTPFQFGGPLPASDAFSNILPSIQISGMQPLGFPTTFNPNNSGINNDFNWDANVGFHSGRHEAKFGIQISQFRSDGFSNLSFGPNGAAVFGSGGTLTTGGPITPNAFANAFASFLVGTPTVTGNTAFPLEPGWRDKWYAAYVTDKIRVTPRLTLDLGLRYDVFSPIQPQASGRSMFYIPSNNTLIFPGTGGTDKNILNYDLNNVGPRFGFAYRFGNKTVIRGGYGISYYQMPFQFSGFMPLTQGVTQGVIGSTPVVTGVFGPTIPGATLTPTNGVAAPNIPLAIVPIDRENPYVQSYSFQIQRETFANMVFNVGYVGTLGRNLPFIQETNVASPGTGVAGLPLAAPFGRTASTLLFGSGLTNNYNSLQVNLTKRFAKSLSLQAAYTYSKSLDFASNQGILLDPFNRRANYGPSDNDRTHNLSIAHLFELPFGPNHAIGSSGIAGKILGGWEINGIFHWDSGVPFTALSDAASCNCPGIPVTQASAIAPISISGGTTTNGTFFPGAAFTSFVSPVNSVGNLGRNRFRGSDVKNYDMSVFKTFPVRDRYKVEIRGEVFNISNSPNFLNPIIGINQSGFGLVNNTLNNSFGRQFNLAARILF